MSLRGVTIPAKPISPKPFGEIIAPVFCLLSFEIYFEPPCEVVFLGNEFVTLPFWCILSTSAFETR